MLGVRRFGFICTVFFFQAFEAIQKILSMSKTKRVHVVLVDRIMTELENRSSSSLLVETEAFS